MLRQASRKRAHLVGQGHMAGRTVEKLNAQFPQSLFKLAQVMTDHRGRKPEPIRRQPKSPGFRHLGEDRHIAQFVDHCSIFWMSEFSFR